jgi:hypothetical protein
MKPVLFLRIASGLTLVHAVLHTIGGVISKPQPGVQATTAATMKAGQFVVMGLTRTFWDFFMGMSIGVSITLLVEAFVFWQLGTLAKTDAARLRPILAAFMVGYLALAVNSYEYFFAPPVIGELLIVACLGLAIATSRQPAAATPARAAILPTARATSAG